MTTGRVQRLVAVLSGSLFLSLLGAACSKDKDGSLVEVQLSSAVAVPSIRSVTISAAAISRAFDVNGITTTPVRLGVFVPATVTGSVPVSARASGGTPCMEYAAQGNAQIVEVGAVVPVPLLLAATGPCGASADAGVSDAAPIVKPDGPPDAPPGGPLDAPPDGQADARPADGSLPQDGSGGADGSGSADAPFGPTNTWRPAENIENDILNPSSFPHVAVDPRNGNALVVWREPRALKARNYDAATGQWGAAKTIDSRAVPYAPKVGIDASGNALIAWYHSGEATANLNGVWFSRSTDLVAWSPPASLVAPAEVYGEFALAVARNGTARVAWEARAGGAHSVWSAHFDGTAWQVPMAPVIMGSDTYEREVRLASDRAGNGILAWTQDDPQKQFNASIWAATFTGAKVDPAAVMEQYTTDEAYIGNVALNRDGVGILAWRQRNPTPTINLEVWVRRYSPVAGWSTPQRVPDITSAGDVNVVIDQGAWATLAWSQTIGTRENLVARRFLINEGWGEAVPLETENKAEARTDQWPLVQLTTDDQGIVNALWRRRDNLAENKTWSLWTARYSNNRWTPALKLAGKDMLQVMLPRLATADNGASVAVFHYEADGISDPDEYNVFAATTR